MPPKGINVAGEVSIDPESESRVMSNVPTSGVRNTATMATSMKALPSIVKIRNFMAEYSFRPLPQMDISMYMGTNSTSQNRKKRSRSNEEKTPMTAVCRIKSQTKCSRTLRVMRHEASTAHRPNRPVRVTSGALRPSTPKK